MREIKFRIYDSFHGGMCQVKYLDLSRIDNSDNTWMQYTGLKDKYGIEIYEGDILLRKIWGFPKPYNENEKYLVKSLSEYMTDGETNGHFSIELWNELCEVVGNIHENPELMEMKC